jgi:hypothetical protein
VLLPAVPRVADLADPQARAELADKKPGFLRKFAASGVLRCLAVLDTAARKLPPAAVRIAPIAALKEQDPAIRVEQQHSAAQPQIGLGPGRVGDLAEQRCLLVYAVVAPCGSRVGQL